MPYRSFSNFKNIQLKFGDPEQGLNYGYTAEPNFSCPDNPLFDTEFFLLFRRSEYAAQIELACAKIFHYLMGYGLEMEILQEGDQFFISSRRIKNFIEGCDSLSQAVPESKGLVSIFLIWYFIGQNDTHSGNYGLANTGKAQLAFGLDMAEALDFSMLTRPLDLLILKQIPYAVENDYKCVSEMELSRTVVASQAFQSEKLAMIKKIAETPFEVFETILRETISSDYSVHQKIMFEKSLALAEDEAEKMQLLENFKLVEAQDYSLDALIRLLKIRHEQWRLLFIKNPEENLEQDYTFADPHAFFEKSNKYHGSTSDDEEETNEELNIGGQHGFFSLKQSGIDSEKPAINSAESKSNPLILMTQAQSFFTHKKPQDTSNTDCIQNSICDNLI